MCKEGLALCAGTQLMQLPPALALPLCSPLQGGFHLAEAVSQAVRAEVGSGEVGVSSGGSWSELWKAPVWSKLAGEHLTQERNHSPAEQVWRGPGFSAAAKPPTPGLCLAGFPIPSAGTRRAGDGVTHSRRDQGSEGIQQAVL